MTRKTATVALLLTTITVTGSLRIGTTAQAQSCINPVADLKACPRLSSSGIPAERNGCGPAWLPSWFPAPQGLGDAHWSPRCDIHDDCYGECGSTRASCDSNLYMAMLQECARAYPPRQVGPNEDYNHYTVCASRARLYNSLVVSLGQGAWETAQKIGCQCCSGGWGGTINCNWEASGTRTNSAGVTTSTTESRRVALTAQNLDPEGGFVQLGTTKITALSATHTFHQTEDQDMGTVTCPVHRHTVTDEAASRTSPVQDDMVTIYVLESVGSYLWTAKVADTIGSSTTTTTYTGGGDPQVCAPLPPGGSVTMPLPSSWFCDTPVTTFMPGDSIMHTADPEIDTVNFPPTTLTKSWRFDRR